MKKKYIYLSTYYKGISQQLPISQASNFKSIDLLVDQIVDNVGFHSPNVKSQALRPTLRLKQEKWWEKKTRLSFSPIDILV